MTGCGCPVERPLITPGANARCRCPVQTNTPCECPVNVPTATALCQHLMNSPSANHGIVEWFGLEEALKITLFPGQRHLLLDQVAPSSNLSLNTCRDGECPAPMPREHPRCKCAMQTPCADDQCERPVDIPSANAPFQCPMPIPGASAWCNHHPVMSWGTVALAGSAARLSAGFSGAGGRRLLTGVRTDSAAPELLCGGRVPAHCCALRR